MTAIRLLSSDTPAQRAANIRELAGITTGDPEMLEQQQAEIARAIQTYCDLDAEARGNTSLTPGAVG